MTSQYLDEIGSLLNLGMTRYRLTMAMPVIEKTAQIFTISSS